MRGDWLGIFTEAPDGAADGATTRDEGVTTMTNDEVTELHNDLMRRAEMCDALAKQHRAAAKSAGTDLVETWEAETAEARTRGKADAYRHAAELLRAAAKGGA